VAAIISDDADIVHQYGISSLISVSGQPMRLEDTVPNKVSLIKNSIKQSMMAIKTGKELKKN
jgi:glycerate kinase